MRTTAPRATLILPTYNHLRYLPLAVETALKQTLEDIELIIVNDGSTDGTRDWLDKLSDPRVRVIHQENAGPAAAINAGIRASTAAYVSWISADNFCAPYFAEALVAALDADAASVLAYSPFYTINADNRIEGIRFDNLMLLRELVTNRPRGVAGFMYRKSMHDELGMYEGWALDTLMWARMLEKYSAVFVLEPTYFYRFHDDRATVTRKPEVADAVAEITTSYLKRFNLDRTGAFKRLYPGLITQPGLQWQAHSDFASRLAVMGQLPEARDLLDTALAEVAPEELLRPLVNAVGVCLMSGADPTAFVAKALARNTRLTRDLTDAAADVADAMAVVAASGGRAELLGIEIGSVLAALEKPKVFSYTAWCHDKSTVPVSGV
jgi:Glycosyl transferase family 2